MVFSAKDELATLARAVPSGIVTAADAASAWEIDTRAASRRLGVLAGQGWLRRIRHGTYHIPALDAPSNSSATYDDPWTLAATVFAPCYIGGWSAAEHWGLTEQLFKDTFVVTASSARSTQTVLGGLSFRLARVESNRAIGDTLVWRRTTKVSCASPERVLVDCANAPSWIGGIRHLAEVMSRYSERPAPDLNGFATSLARFGRGAGAKRLGYISERLLERESDDTSRTALKFIRGAALAHRRAGVVKLDPSVRSRGRMSSAWGLWVNTEVVRQEPS